MVKCIRGYMEAKWALRFQTLAAILNIKRVCLIQTFMALMSANKDYSKLQVDTVQMRAWFPVLTT